jgi:hypothetical protein
MQENAAALDVAEKPVAKPGAFMRAFDQPGNVGEHDINIARAHHTKVRVKRCERIVGNLRFGSLNRSQKG